MWMPSRLNELLDERFRALGCGPSNVERAEYLGTDEATYSRIINGRRKLSRQRAADWAAKLHPNESDDANRLESAFLSLETVASSQKPTVDEFCADILNQGGWVPA